MLLTPMTPLYKKIPESATDSGIFYFKPYKSCRLCLLRNHGVHRVRRIVAGSYSPTKQRCAHVNVALQTADDFARRSIELRTSVTKVQLFPHSPNIVTSECQLHLEIRAESEENAREAAKQLTDRFTEIEAASSTRIKVTGTEMRPSMAFPESGISLIERAATTCGITCMRTKTVCGHDAVALAAHVPTALMFVPSVGSHAHAPNEFTKPEDLANGVRTLEQALRICVANGDFPAEGK